MALQKVSIASSGWVSKVMTTERGEIIQLIYKTSDLEKSTEYLMAPGSAASPGSMRSAGPSSQGVASSSIVPDRPLIV